MQSWLNRAVFGISPNEASFARRGFQDTTLAKRAHLENIGRTFISGYLASLETRELDALAERLNAVAAEFRGFAFEGAGMGLALTDHVWRRRSPKLKHFLEESGAAHCYMLHVGYGWALARLPWLRRHPERSLGSYDARLGWLILDGYGFHEGYFHWRSTIRDMRVPDALSGAAARVFDQGLGRSLWFYNGADVERAADCIHRFAPQRRPDLWSGLGLAATYAGGVCEPELSGLLHLAGEYRSHLAQGAAFAAKARHVAGNPTPHTGIACRLFCGVSSSQAAELTDSALAAIQRSGVAGEPYEAWRSEIRAQLQGAGAAVSQSS
jgi:enediyne biosynthesis protein E3